MWRKPTGWVTKEQSHDAESFPLVDLGDVDQVDIDKEWQGPDLSEGRGKGKLAPNFGDVGERQHCNHMENRRWNDEKVGFEGAESKTFQGQGQVLRRCGFGDLEHEPNEIQWP